MIQLCFRFSLFEHSWLLTASNVTPNRVSPSGGDWRSPSHYPKNWLVPLCPHQTPEDRYRIKFRKDYESFRNKLIVLVFALLFFFKKKKTLWPLFMDSVKLSKNWPCWSHIDLGLIACSRNRGLQLYLKETPTQVFSCELCEIFKNTFFMEHLQTTASRNRMKNASPTGYFKVHHTMMSFLLFHPLCQEIRIFIQA